MSGRIVGEVLDYAPDDLTETQWRVLICLAESARDADRTSRTNTKEIARRARRAEGSIRRAVTELTSRCLIQPIHPHAKIGRGRLAQQYRLAQFEAYHRATTARPTKPVDSVTPDGDAIELNSVTPGCDTKPLWITPGEARIASHGELNSVTPGCDTTRNYLPVTTVSNNSSKQVTPARTRDQPAPAHIVARVAAIRARHRQPTSTPVPDEAPALAPLGCAAGLRSAPSGHETRAGP